MRYHAVRALVGLDMRRSLRYFTPVFSVAFEGGEVSLRRYEKCQNFLSLESDREYGREVAQMAPHMQADHSAHRAVSLRVSARSKRTMVASGPGSRVRVPASSCIGARGHKRR